MSSESVPLYECEVEGCDWENGDWRYGFADAGANWASHMSTAHPGFFQREES